MAPYRIRKIDGAWIILRRQYVMGGYYYICCAEATSHRNAITMVAGEDR